MEMSAEYLRETAERMRDEGGYELAVSHREPVSNDGEVVYHLTRYQLRKGDDRQLALECLEYEAGHVHFYAELLVAGPVRADCARLDSWKSWPDRVELKFYALPDTGRALAVVWSY